MRKVIIITVILFAFVCCKNQTPRSNQEDISPNKTVETVEKRNKQEINIEALEGTWAENEDENALFWIENDSLYSVEHIGDAVKIDIINDTLIIYYEGITVKDFILKLDSDSLILLNEVDNIIKLYKR